MRRRAAHADCTQTTLELVTSQAMASANNEDRETFYSPLPGNRAGSDDEDEVEPITPPPPPRFPTTLELVRTIPKRRDQRRRLRESQL